MRFSSKPEIIDRIEAEHRALVELITTIPRSRLREEGVWGDGWSVHDLLAHLTEWEQMLLRWYREGKAGGVPALPAPGYKWNETPRLNRDIQRKHCRRSTKMVLEEFHASYLEILALARRLPPRQLLEPGHFAWTGSLPLGSYLGPNSSSHYRTASRLLNRWLKGIRRQPRGAQ